MKKILLYVGPVRMLETWLAENLRLFGENSNGAGAERIRREAQKKSHRKGGRNWK